jgi:hypothetical protein
MNEAAGPDGRKANIIGRGRKIRRVKSSLSRYFGVNSRLMI